MASAEAAPGIGDPAVTRSLGGADGPAGEAGGRGRA